MNISITMNLAHESIHTEFNTTILKEIRGGVSKNYFCFVGIFLEMKGEGSISKLVFSSLIYF